MPAVVPTLSALALLGYLLAFGHLWRSLQHSSGQLGITAEVQSTLLGPSVALIMLSAVLCHGFASTLLMVKPEGVYFSLPYVSNIISLILTLMITVSSLRIPTSSLFLLVLPIGGLHLLAINLLSPTAENLLPLSRQLFLHILLSLSAYAILMAAALHSILLAVREFSLKKLGTRRLIVLPPLETMEALHLFMIWSGLGLLSLSILSGVVILDDMLEQRLAHHTLLTGLSWLVYASFLVGHYVLGWRGITAVRWNLSAFALLLLGYLGSKFVLEYLLSNGA